MTPTTIWPPHSLHIRTERLTLSPVREADWEPLVNLVRAGIHDPEFMPFMVPFTRMAEPERTYNAVRYYAAAQGMCNPQDWKLPLAVRDQDGVVGIQEISAKQFAVVRCVNTGSWLAQRFQGRGYGVEMRAAVVRFAFETLGAVRAESAAFDDNRASIAVSQKLGYQHNGHHLHLRDDTHASRCLEFALDSDRIARNILGESYCCDYDPSLLAFLGCEESVGQG